MSTSNLNSPSDIPTAPPVAIPMAASGLVLPWLPMAWFAALFCLVFGAVILSLADDWYNEESMSHGFFVPLIAGYIAYEERRRIFGQPINPSWFGLIPVILGFLLMLIGILGADFFVPRIGLMLSLVGVLWTLGGTWTLRRVWFPLFILLFMIRIPLFIYSQITFPLQILASSLAERALSMLGVPVLRDGNILELASQKLNVVEACSGIRSLMTLSLLALVYGYFFDEKKWMRWVLLVLGIPIAIFANASRITITGLLSEYQKEFAQGFYHSLEGYVIFLATAVGLFATHHLVNRVYGYWAGGRNRPPATAGAHRF